MLPPRDGAATTPGDFTTLTGNNGGNWLDGKSTAQLQHWRDSGTTLTILKNETVHFVGAPGGESAMGQSGQIARLGDGTLLAAFYGYAPPPRANASRPFRRPSPRCQAQLDTYCNNATLNDQCIAPTVKEIGRNCTFPFKGLRDRDRTQHPHS